MATSKRFVKSLSSLKDILQFLTNFAQAEHLQQETAEALNLSIEEIFVNMVKYNNSSANDISINLDRVGSSIVTRLTDFDVDRFDITETKPFDTNMTLAKRHGGGLGIHLVNSMMDEVRYEYNEGNSTVILVKNLG